MGFFINSDGKLETGAIDLESDVDVMEKTETSDSDGSDLGPHVILYNDNYHTFDQVIYQLMKAIKCSERKAFDHAMEVHTKGKSIVFKGEESECINVINILNEINLNVELKK